MDFQQYIQPELLILIPVLYLVGIAIKKSEIADKYIPLILGVAGVILSAVYVLATNDISGNKAVATAIFTSITQGILAAGASVYANQLLKQAGKDEK